MHGEFVNSGVLRLPGVIATDAVSRVRDELWREIGERFGIRSESPESWFRSANKPAGDFRGRRLSGMNPVMKSLQSSGTLDVLEASLGAAVRDALAPATWVAKAQWYSLLSFPGEGAEWNVPHRSWHADEPVAAGHTRPWTVFGFVFLKTVLPRGGGGTVVVSGSHRCGQHLAQTHGRIDPEVTGAFADDNHGLVDPQELRVLGATDTIGRLAKESLWFKELISEGSPTPRIEGLMERGGHFEGIPVKVVELSGAPGDIVLLDPRCLHSVSVNTSGMPREILRLDFRRLPDE